MNRSPVLATLLVVFFMVGVPVALIQRLAEGVLPTQAYDIPLGVGVIAWVFVAKAILGRDDPLTTLVENRMSPNWQAHSLVEQSLLGVGFTGRQPALESNSHIHRLTSPYVSTDELMPPYVRPVHSLAPGFDRRDLDNAAAFRAQPTLGPSEPIEPLQFETEEYVVARGDTFWSIAEERLGEGRRWKSVQDLNLDREVAPGVYYRTDDSIRIGWTVLVPVAQPVEDAA